MVSICDANAELIMSTFIGPTSIANDACNDFMITQLPLYSGSLVTISVGEDGPKHKISKALICDKSPYFAAMFAENKFKEGEDQQAILEIVQGVVSESSLSMLVQWLYTGMVSMKCSTTPKAISRVLEFARFADFAGLNTVGEVVAKYLQTVIIANSQGPFGNLPSNAQYLNHQHIISGFQLPRGHPVRRILAMACVKDHLRSKQLELWSVMEDIPEFAVELVKVTTQTLATFNYGAEFKDPFTQKSTKLRD